jgi:hypothetical protein
MLENFFSKIAEVSKFYAKCFVEDMVAELKEKLQDDVVLDFLAE